MPSNPYPNDSANMQPDPSQYPNDPPYGQPGPYPNDPNYPAPGYNPNYPPYAQPTEVNPQGSPYQQGGQNIQPPYQRQEPYRQAPKDQESRKIKYAIAKIIDYITWAILVLEALFLLRFFLKLVGADPTNPFAQFLYNFTGFFLYPFFGIVPNAQYSVHLTHIFEWSTLIGMLVYGLIFWILKYFLRTTISRPQEPIY
jgi:YGGT family